MNRVWKHFLKNLAWPVGILAYVTAVAFGAAYANTLFKGAGAFIAFVFAIAFVGLPVGVYLVREMWIDAKKQVERENRDMLNTIKGNN